MISNYLKTAVRSFKNNKGVSAINIIGLSAGIAACILIMIYVMDELNYDRYNVNAKRIYRITENVSLTICNKPHTIMRFSACAVAPLPTTSWASYIFLPVIALSKQAARSSIPKN